MPDIVKFPSAYRFGDSESEGKQRFDEFEKMLFHNWNTALANPTLWYILFSKVPAPLLRAAQDTTINLEGPNEYIQSYSNRINLRRALKNELGCFVVHSVDLPNIEVQAGRADTVMGGYYGGLVSNQIQEQNVVQMEFRETQSSIVDIMIRPWVEAVAKNGLIAREPTGRQRQRDCKTNLTVVHLGVAGPGTDPIKRKIWTFYDCCPTSVANQRLAHDGTWQAPDMFINTSWVYSRYQIKDVEIDNISDVYKAHVQDPAIRPKPGARTSGRVSSNDGPAGEIQNAPQP